MLNKVALIGNMGADADMRQLPNGTAVASISLATTRRWKDKQSGERKEHTEWHRVVFFNRLAEVVGEYLRKGSQIYIEGRLQTRKWQDKQGDDRYTTEIVAGEMNMLGGKPGGVSVPASAPGSSTMPELTPNSGAGDGFDDDVPF